MFPMPWTYKNKIHSFDHKFMILKGLFTLLQSTINQVIITNLRNKKYRLLRMKQSLLKNR